LESRILIDEPGFVASGRLHVPQGGAGEARHPLIVAIHGGGFTSEYFDIAGYSLLDRAVERGCGVIGLDRMGHGGSRADGRADQSLANNRAWIIEAVDRLWPRFADRCSGVVLVGHSIGAALSVMVAADAPDWPLTGVAISGAALAPNPALEAYFSQLPTDPWMESPAEGKDRLMLGLAGTFDPAMLDPLHRAYRPVSSQELGEIYSVWTDGAAAFFAAAKVPIHFRIGEQDALWVVDDASVRAVGALISGIDGSSAAIVPGAGHAIDFHRAGADFHRDQLDFALGCAPI